MDKKEEEDDRRDCDLYKTRGDSILQSVTQVTVQFADLIVGESNVNSNFVLTFICL